jgi:hypothetical protein
MEREYVAATQHYSPISKVATRRKKLSPASPTFDTPGESGE